MAIQFPSSKPRFPRSLGLTVARELCARLTPHCERIIVAGSLRRKKPDIGDVEIIFIPKLKQCQADLFSVRMVSLADEEITRMLGDGTVTKRPSKTGSTAWGAKNKLALHRSGMPVDFFATTEDSWANYLVCRTGPADSNTAIATEAKRLGYQWNPYGSGFTNLTTGAVAFMHTESDVFAFVGIPYREPCDR